ncbi:MAG: anti-sigma F factor [bacterium]|nr:anti-sigma F factor [bacterium]
MKTTNEMELLFDSRSENEGFARVAVSAFLTQMNPTLEEVEDVRTAVSEAVTNAIIHGYEGKEGKIRILSRICDGVFYIEIKDDGVGIPDVAKAMEPLFTTKPDLERSGLGFVFMQSFMDEVEVESKSGEGTLVKMKKHIGKGQEIWTTQSL